MTDTAQAPTPMIVNNRAVPSRISEYLSSGGLWNPELADHDEVRHILIDARDVVEILERVVQILERELAQARADVESYKSLAAQTPDAGLAQAHDEIRRLRADIEERDGLLLDHWGGKFPTDDEIQKLAARPANVVRNLIVEVDKLRAQLDERDRRIAKLESFFTEAGLMQLGEEVLALRERCEGLEADARRYRWLERCAKVCEDMIDHMKEHKDQAGNVTGPDFYFGEIDTLEQCAAAIRALGEEGQ